MNEGVKAQAERLGQLRSLQAEVNELSQRIAEMENAATRGSARITGMPRGGGNFDRVGEYSARITDMSEVLRNRRGRCMDLIGEIYAFVDEIENSALRRLFTFRYVDGLTWAQIAYRLEERDEQVPRKRHDAYLARRLQEHQNLTIEN